MSQQFVVAAAERVQCRQLSYPPSTCHSHDHFRMFPGYRCTCLFRVMHMSSMRYLEFKGATVAYFLPAAFL
jgi:hypothetical protein